MRLSFSTVGCPDWMLDEVIAAARDLGYDGIELRGIGPDLFLPAADVFGPKRLETSLKQLREAKLGIPCVATDAGCLLSSKNPDVADNIRAYIDLAALIGADNIRLLGDEWGKPMKGLDKEQVYKTILKVLPYAEEKGIPLLVETNGVYAETKVLRELIRRVDSPLVRVLWDINHPVVYFGESPEETFENIGEYVRHVHVKDSVLEDGKLTYKLLGHGTLPAREIFALLKGAGYEGYLSLEWLKRWHDDLEEPGIVIGHYIQKIKRMM